MSMVKLYWKIQIISKAHEKRCRMSLELKHKDVDKVVVKYGGKTIVC